MSFKQIRIVLLLLILAMVVHHQVTGKARVTSWQSALFVAIYPVNADGSQAAEDYIATLRQRDFQPLAEYMRDQARQFGVTLDRPLYLELGRSPAWAPPDPPDGAGVLKRSAWVLRMRWWRWRFDDQGLKPDIVLIARYFDPEVHKSLPHSTGLEHVRVAIANLFAKPDMAGQNLVVLVHELLHTLGATDKYDPATDRPLFPDGYAAPDQSPRHPQRQAEIMAGRRAVSPTEAEQAESLRNTLVGPKTAAEIGWVPANR
ncbi:MAG: hypothetical protein ACNA7E_00450 [Wenzhouxiangellaceae bacterium]